MIDADISTISGVADKVLRVRGRPDWLLHLEFQSGHDSAQLPQRMLVNNTLLDYRHGLPVCSVAVILHPEADSPRLTGLFRRQREGSEPHVEFRYQVVRVWQLPPAMLLAGGLSLLPLAPISDVPREQLPEVIERIKKRLVRERNQKLVQTLWTATFILMGLRYPQALATSLLQGVTRMKESVTYQAIVEEGKTEGKIEEARNFLLAIGRDRLGEPPPKIRSALDSISDVKMLEALGIRTAKVTTWGELLEGTQAKRQSDKKRKNT